MSTFAIVIVLLIPLFLIMGPFVTVSQGTVAVITVFGKYRRIMMPGLNFRIPFIENVARRISIQNQASTFVSKSKMKMNQAE